MASSPMGFLTVVGDANAGPHAPKAMFIIISVIKKSPVARHSRHRPRKAVSRAPARRTGRHRIDEAAGQAGKRWKV